MTSSNRFPTLLSLCAGKPHRGQSEFSSRRDSNADLWCFCYQSEKKLLNKHSIGRNFETPWRSFDVVVMHWIVSMVVAGGLTPIWCQDILNRRDEIGQLHIYRHAFFFIKIVPWYQLLCGSGNVTQCKRLHFCFFCDCVGVLFVITVMQSIPAWCYFCWSVIECHQYR